MKLLPLSLLALFAASVSASGYGGTTSPPPPPATPAPPIPVYCTGTFELQISAVDFAFQSCQGGGVNTVNYGPGFVWWGVDVGNGQSGLTTSSNVPNGPVVPGPEFPIGTLTHHNNPIQGGSSISHVELTVTVTANSQPYTFVYQLSIHETPNHQSPCPYVTTGSGCSDRIFIIDNPAPQALTLPGGINFEIDLLGFRACPTCPLKTQFISQESMATSAQLYANLVLTDCPHTGGGGGDPHFETWTGHQIYDYMGACDMHLIQAPHFAPGLPMTVDVRTKICPRNFYSFIESAVVQIGDETLEVGSFGEYLLNGVEGADMPATIAGFEVNVFNPNKNFHIVEIYLGEGKKFGNEKIVLRAFKDMVTVRIEYASKERFHGSTGMMGEFETGVVLARDGITRLEDPIEIANEWQVRDTDQMLFDSVNGPQYPEACILPDLSAEQAARRLRGNTVSKEAAEKACARWSHASRAGCVTDVMATGDLELAQAGGF